MRSKYAMINLIKNKLRAAGQRDPMVMAVDACEEVVNEDEKKKIETTITPLDIKIRKKSLEKPVGTPPTKKGLRYNPYGTGTANPSNLSVRILLPF